MSGGHLTYPAPKVSVAGPPWLNRLRFYLSVSAVYALTLIFAASFLKVGPFHPTTPVLANSSAIIIKPAVKPIVVTIGKPNRVVLPRLGIDLPVIDGEYDEANKTWTLSGYKAQFALPSMQANNAGGNTLIYGHNNKYVFGKLVGLQPGDELQIFTDNNLVFHYTFAGSEDQAPDNTSIFTYQGPPRATLQSCVGTWNETRRMYLFNFERVE